jgi:hypothetical protein
MLIAFDLDNTLCTQQVGKTYAEAEPIQAHIDVVNRLFDEGNIITIYTARGGTTGLDWRSLTEAQLTQWGVKYHFLNTTKIHYDLLVCDRAINADTYFKEHSNEKDKTRTLS